MGAVAFRCLQQCPHDVHCIYRRYTGIGLLYFSYRHSDILTKVRNYIIIFIIIYVFVVMPSVALPCLHIIYTQLKKGKHKR